MGKIAILFAALSLSSSALAWERLDGKGGPIFIQRLAETKEAGGLTAVGIDCIGGSVHIKFWTARKPPKAVVYLLTDLGSDEFRGKLQQGEHSGYILTLSDQPALKLAKIVRSGLPELEFSYGLHPNDPEGQGVVLGAGLQMLDAAGACSAAR